MKLSRFIQTVAHLRPGQVYWRARYMAERRLGVRRVPPLPAETPAWDAGVLGRLRAMAAAWGALDHAAAARAEAFRAGRFRFLNVEADFSSGVDWASPGRARLWRYQLHYFDCVKELALAGAAEDAGLAAQWQQDWIVRNPPGTDVAWDAFTISARLMNWALAEAVWGGGTPEIARSYLHQAQYLAGHLEWDVQGNHLLKNACALAVAGAALAPDVLPGALRLLRDELEEQILPDGGHYERSPMYHALVLEDLLVTQAALGEAGTFLGPVIARMAGFLAAILHPDGEIPFFGDAALGEARTPGVLLALAGQGAADAPASTALRDSGFFSLRERAAGTGLVVRGGLPGPGHQLGHAHADLFSFELSVAGARVLVNSGTHGYADSPHRGWSRSEAAHNTLEVPGDPQIEAWGAFRVGARYAEPAVLFHPDLGFKGAALLPRGTAVERGIAPDDGGFFVEDTAAGRRVRELIARLHLAPGLRWIEEGGVWRVDGAALRVRMAEGTARVEAGRYFPAFGVEEANEVLVLRAEGAGEARLSYRIEITG